MDEHLYLLYKQFFVCFFFSLFTLLKQEIILNDRTQRTYVVYMLLSEVREEMMSPGKALGGEGVGTAMGTPTLPLPLFSRLLLRLLG